MGIHSVKAKSSSRMKTLPLSLVNNYLCLTKYIQLNMIDKYLNNSVDREPVQFVYI